VIAFLLALAVSAQAAPVRLALIEDSPSAATTAIVPALERALRDAGRDAELLGVDIVACSFTGNDHICRLPSALGAPPTDAASTAVALESEHGVAFVYPPAEDFIAALVKAAADPTSSFRYGAMTLREHEAEASAHVSSGKTILTLTSELDRPSTRRWRAGIAGFYRVRWKGRDMAVLIPGREHGGLGRLAAAAAEAPRPWIGVARGGTLGSTISDGGPRAVLDALERAGLRWSAVGVSEVKHWAELEKYRRERPDGVRFLSANLVYSTDAARGPFPPYAVIDASGTRVALVGLTPDAANASLSRAGLSGLTARDPMAVVDALIPRLRAEADIVILLGETETARSSRVATAGVDLVLGEGPDGFSTVAPPTVVASQDERPAYAAPFPPLRAYHPALNLYEVERRVEDDRASWTVTSRARLLEDTLLPLEGFPARSYDAFDATASTEVPLIPSARSVFAGSERRWPFYTAREFWTLSAGLLAEKEHAEAGLLPTARLMADAPGGLREGLVRLDLGAGDEAVLASVSGARLKSLAAEAAEQKSREDADLPVDVKLRFVVSGFDQSGRLRGSPVDAGGVYRVATSRTAAEMLGLPGPYEVVAGTPTVAAAVLDELKASSPRASAADWRAWMSGSPLSEPGLWRLNFRDVGLNLRQTKVVRSNDFDPVPNSRVQGFNELLVGGVFKADAEYLKHYLKWTNTIEAEYAKSRIEPRDAPALVNLAANRLMLLTLATRRSGKVRQEWFARSWGPSVGVQYDGEFESSPGLKRRQAYSLFPGVEFFDGTFIRSLELSGIVKRDLGREPPNTQTGLRLRSVFSRELGPAKALLQGELWNNYFFLTRKDAAGDLRMEGDFNVKLRIPVRRYLSVAPFLDYYWFQLKTRPTWGYSMTMGVSIGFSRMWKPQYESF
jgi:hypothetical protein